MLLHVSYNHFRDPELVLHLSLSPSSTSIKPFAATGNVSVTIAVSIGKISSENTRKRGYLVLIHRNHEFEGPPAVTQFWKMPTFSFYYLHQEWSATFMHLQLTKTLPARIAVILLTFFVSNFPGIIRIMKCSLTGLSRLFNIEDRLVFYMILAVLPGKIFKTFIHDPLMLFPYFSPF